MPDPYAMAMPPGPDMGMVPPGPGAMPPEAMPPEMGAVPPAPEEMLGATPEPPPVSVPGWVPADPEIPIDENTCGEIGAIPYEDKEGKQFCMIQPPGGLPPGPLL